MKVDEFINSCDINHLLLLKDKQTLEINIRSFAGQSVSMARIEEKERALQALQTVLVEWMPGSAKVILDDFKAELEAKQ